MFQFRRFPTYAYLIQRRLLEYCSSGFPHSVIPGSMLMCSSPRLIAACHDLLRLLMPRHSPCALISLTSDVGSPPHLLILKNYVHLTEKFNFGLLSFYPSKQLSPFIVVSTTFASIASSVACSSSFTTLFSFQGAILLVIKTRSKRSIP